ncbi:MAG: SPOR domain-containing protein [bacterium]
MTLPQRLSLPDGYRVSEADGSLRLFDPQGTLLEEVPQGLAATAEIRSRAWLDAWEHIERELKDELRDFREGTRPLHDMPRVRQYMRMLDAMAKEPAQARERAGRGRFIAVMTLATAAAAAAVVILATTPLPISQGPQEAQEGIRITQPATISAPPEPSTAGVAKPRRKSPASAEVKGRASSRMVAMPRPARTVGAAGGAAGLSAITGYMVGFGEFASRAPAEIRMRLVRAKGYIVYVTQVGNSFQVVTRPYRMRDHAERLANALNEIGLPTTIQAATTAII